MGLLMIVLGIAVLLGTLGDLLWTVLAASGGAGPMTSRLNHRLWQAVRHSARGNHRVMRMGGVAIFLISILVWVGLLWAGWSLVFLGGERTIVTASGARPATAWEQIYFVGYTLSTMGNGELQPAGTAWRLITDIASLNGIAVVTLGITYFVPVVSAVTARRKLALQISNLGSDPRQIICRTWQNGSWQAFERHLEQLTPELTDLAQRHLAYPVLHYFHDLDRDAAVALRVAVLDETITLLEHGVDTGQNVGPDVLTLRALRSSLSAVLGALTSAFIALADEPPAPPDLRQIRQLGCPTRDQRHFREAVGDLAQRRRALLGFVRDDGWDWEDVYPGVTIPEQEEQQESAEERPRDTLDQPADERQDDTVDEQQRGSGGRV